MTPITIIFERGTYTASLNDGILTLKTNINEQYQERTYKLLPETYTFSLNADGQLTVTLLLSESESIQIKYLLDHELIKITNDKFNITGEYFQYSLVYSDLRSIALFPKRQQFYYVKWRQTDNKADPVDYTGFAISTHQKRIRESFDIAIIKLNEEYTRLFEIRQKSRKLDISFLPFQKVQELYIKRVTYIPLAYLMDSNYFIWVLCQNDHPNATKIEDIPLLTR